MKSSDDKPRLGVPVTVKTPELPYFVATKATDGEWVVRATFECIELANDYAIHLNSLGIDARLLRDANTQN